MTFHIFISVTYIAQIYKSDFVNFYNISQSVDDLSHEFMKAYFGKISAVSRHLQNTMQVY